MKQANKPHCPVSGDHKHQQDKNRLKRENMEYIASLLYQLRIMAEKDGHDMLVYLIEMAEAEAQAAMNNTP